MGWPQPQPQPPSWPRPPRRSLSGAGRAAPNDTGGGRATARPGLGGRRRATRAATAGGARGLTVQAQRSPSSAAPLSRSWLLYRSSRTGCQRCPARVVQPPLPPSHERQA
ncbi:hypothetical protein BS78_02G100400 [Paspalum vaginatum]|nr:hypothetical protein BS78_02G100400 [Paspalum vaginatum]